MISNERKKHIDKKYFDNTIYDYKYFFKKYDFCNKEKRSLDAGCGSGQNLRYFSQQSVGITYTDDEAIEYVKEKYSLNLVKFNIENEWPNDLGKFDLIFNADNIIHLSSPFKLLLELRKVLKDDGRILLQIPQSSPFFKADISTLHPYTFNKKTLIHLMEHAGFEVEDTFGYIRKLPIWLNQVLNFATKLWGPNMWIVAKKKEDFKIDTRNIRPDWINKEVWFSN